MVLLVVLVMMVVMLIMVTVTVTVMPVQVTVTVTVMLVTKTGKMSYHNQLQGWSQKQDTPAKPFRATGMTCHNKNSQAFQDKLTKRVKKSRAAC